MKALDVAFPKIINGATQFVIPVFQRDYNWQERHCAQLWQDVLRVAQAENVKHFLGSFVYVQTDDSAAGFTRYLLIDGQQRLTTLMLLLIALRDHIIEENWVGSDHGPNVKKIDSYFLKNLEESGDRQYKLILRRRDEATIRALIDRSESPEKCSERVIENYEFFRERIKDTDPELIYGGVSRLIIVDVKLDRGADDPQLVFESLNSTGLDLSQSDLIRNFILMRLPEREQTRLYEQYWSKIETLFRGVEQTFDSFIRDYIALHTSASKQEKADQIYFAFRREFGATVIDLQGLEPFLERLLRFARHYAAFSIGTGSPEGLAEPLTRLRRLVDVPAILVMKLFELQRENPGFSIQSFAEAVGLLESYIFRRAIIEGKQTRGYWQIFANLAYTISTSSPLESLKVALAMLPESYSFPMDDEFRDALRESDIYHKRVCSHLLGCLENYENREAVDTGKFSIEHVLPQNERLGSEWRKMLGENWRDVQRQWVHRLGNLTLTGYNSTYSDRPFAEKKTIEGGFADSSVRLNRYIREQEVWTAREIEERGETLASRALRIWSDLVVDSALIEAARNAELRQRALKRDVSKVPMSQTAKQLLEVLRKQIVAIDPAIIELAEQKSVSYHAPGPTFFVEVLPRKNRLVVLVALDYGGIDDPTGIAEDALQWKFFANAVYEGGVMLRIEVEEDVAQALPIVRKAFEVARS